MSLLRKGLFALAPLLALTACLASPRAAQDVQAGAKLTLQGQLALQGNEPFVKAVLVADDGQRWELVRLAREAWLPLQRRRVELSGRVLRTPDPAGGPALPQIEVHAITTAPVAHLDAKRTTKSPVRWTGLFIWWGH